MRNYISILLINLFILSFGQLSAQDYIVNVQQFGEEEGLAHRHISNVCKDKSGFLWLPFDRQLQRYDGYVFKTFPLPKFIGTPTYISLCDDSWLALFNIFENKLLFFNPLSGETMTKEQRWEVGLAGQYETLYKDYIHVEIKNNRLYILNHKGVTEVNLQTGVQKLVVPSKLYANNDVRIKFIDSKNNVWVGSESEMMVVSPQQKMLYTYSKPSINSRKIGLIDLKGQKTPIEAIKEVNQKGVEQQNLYKFKDNDEKEFLASIPVDVQVHQFLDDQIWCISDFGWQVFDTSGNLLFALNKKDYHKRLFEGIRFSKIIKDEFGKFYLPTEFGLNIIEVQKNLFTQYFSNTDKHSLPIKNSARGIDVKGDSIFVHFEFSGFVHLQKSNPENYQILDNKRFSYFHNDFTDYYIRPILRDSRGNLWGGHDKFLTNRVHPSNNLEPLVLTKKTDNHLKHIWSLFEDKQGCIWAGSINSLGRICLSDSFPEYFNHSDLGFNFNHLAIHQIQEDKNEKLWLCTDKGLFVFDKNTQKYIEHYHEDGDNKYTIPATVIYSMYIDEQENRWLGTQSGLVFWNPKTNEKRLFTRKDGLSNNVIYAVFEDDYNKLWLSSDYGIMSFHKETFDVQVYLPKDGIAQKEFNRISHFQESDGRIYFGGLNGVTAFHPKDFEKKEKDYAQVLISDFEIFSGEEGKLVDKLGEISETKTIIFHPSDRYFRLKFVLPTFEKTSKILYAWKIEGVDSDWNYQKENSLQIGMLPYGNHVLKIKAQNGGGWSPHELGINVHVLKPFYFQLWFILAAIATLIFGAYLFFKRRTRLLKETQKLLETEIKKATSQIEQDKKTIEIQAEELRQLDKVKSRFFANVSHELRTPLTLMLGPISSALKRGRLENQDFTLLKKAQQGGKDLLKLVASILDLSKMESGKMELYEKPELLYKLTRRIAASFESHAQREGIQFEYNYLGQDNLQVNLDREKLEIILNNLLSNAIKFTPKNGKVAITVEDASNLLKMKVEDTGRGIHSTDIAHVFDRFYQSAQPNAPTEGGTGIGLAVSKEFAQLMDGKIWVESEMGVGTTFFLEIPRKEVLSTVEGGRQTGDDGRWMREESLSALLTPNGGLLPTSHENQSLDSEIMGGSTSLGAGGKKRDNTILIVEDNHSLRDYLETVLSPHYQVLTAEHGQVALDKLNLFVKDGKLIKTANSPQLILSDIMMPVMDGYQLLSEIKNSPKFQHLPIIMLTARADIQDKLKALRIGVDDYLLKPFIEEELLARIDNLLKNSEERYNFIAENEPEKEHPTTSKVDTLWLESLEKSIQKNLSDSLLSVSNLSAEFAMSESTFRRQLKRLTGLSPIKYLQEFRLNEARQLLENKTHNSILKVVEQVGYKDPSTFARIYKKRFGKLPSEY